jgi:mono/diheme cytochrome c family protein
MLLRQLFTLSTVAGGLLLCVATPHAVGQQKQPSASQIEFFEKSVRPVLAANCFECHGPMKQKGRLRLDSRPMMMEGGSSGPALMPGNPKESLLIQAIHYNDSPKMPPKGKMSDTEIAILTQWVQQGAPWPETSATIRPSANKGFKITADDRAFWSFQPLAKAALPKVKDAGWTKNAIDHFLLAELEAHNLQPMAPAGKRTLIRRATFDLIGLPPTPEEIDAFLSDESPDAFAKVVDRLLASPHYGERMARHWLDVARYGEDQAHTFEARKYPQGFRYRDWLVAAFNADLPYDHFLVEQLAADLLPGKEVENLPALGFFALGPVYYGDPKKLDQIDDRIDTLSRGLLGLTVACSRCHDHKYDPISTKDYYALAGVIASTDYVELSLEPGKEGQPVPPPPKDAKDKKKAPPKGPFIHALKDTNPVTMKVHLRGNPKTLGEEAPRRFLEILGGSDKQPFKKGSGRLELAQAIADKDNPLTARVMANRMWQHHFGKGLVRTPSNFGALGERPTHPQLLDYLAAQFIASGWSTKTLHREIMLSAAYQMSTRFDARGFEADPDNKWLWRMNRQRLDVEAWRDAMLAVAGTLDHKIGGPSLDLNAADNQRRTLYGSVSRHELNSLLRLFDFPDPNITSEKRTVTTVPLQQLFVLNSEFMVRNAKALAARLTAKPGLDDAERIRSAFGLVFGRPASDRELQMGLNFLSASSPTNASAKTTLSRWEQYAQVLLMTNEFLFVD